MSERQKRKKRNQHKEQSQIQETNTKEKKDEKNEKEENNEEENVDINAEEIPLQPNSLKMDILLATSSMQHQNGLRVGDYLRYSHFCRKKIQKLRKLFKLSQGKKKFKKLPITPIINKN